MNLLAASSVILAAAAGWCVWRRRAVYALGPYGPALAPAALLTLWYAAFWVGQFSGSLAGAGWAGALSLTAVAVWSHRRTRPRTLSPLRWSRVDFSLLLLIAVYLLVQPSWDIDVHFSLIATYLRGNIPPSAFNDPSAPLGYHVLFDASAALLSAAFGFSYDLAMDGVTLILVAAVVSNLQALSRLLFKTAWARQAARLFALFGFGPVYLGSDYFRMLPFNGEYWILHGRTTQSFVAMILRPATNIAFLVYTLLLTAFLAHLPSRERPEPGRRHAPSAWLLLPAFFILPQSAEELALWAAAGALWLCLSGRWSVRQSLACGAALAASALSSPVFWEMLKPAGGAQNAPLSWLWPPVLLSFFGSAPLFSWKAAGTLFYEWGPVYIATMAACMTDARRRAGTILLLFWFVPACVLGIGRGWDTMSLDRFFFYTTFLGFLLAALWVEKIERAASRRYALAGCLALCVAVTLGPLAQTGYRIARHLARPAEIPQLLRPAPTPLEKTLSVIGARELIVTDREAAQWMLNHGFLVAAPLELHRAGVRLDLFADYEASFRGRPDWYFLPKNDPRLAGLEPTAYAMGRVLARAARRR